MRRVVHMFALVAAFAVAGCSSAPEKADEPAVEKPSEQFEPTPEKLSECPCGDADWSEPPPGSTAPSSEKSPAGRPGAE